MFANQRERLGARGRIVLLLCPDVHDVRLYLHSLVKHWSVPFSNPRRLWQKRGYAVMGIIFGERGKDLRSPGICPRRPFEGYIAAKKRDALDETLRSNVCNYIGNAITCI